MKRQKTRKNGNRKAYEAIKRSKEINFYYP